jgi:hypothetical protein
VALAVDLPPPYAVEPIQRLGFLQADAYGAYDGIYAGSNGTIVEVACWAHARNKFKEAEATDPARRACRRPKSSCRPRRYAMTAKKKRVPATLPAATSTTTQPGSEVKG